jgi:transposase
VPRHIGRTESHLTAGEDVTLLLPWVNTEMMDLFLGRMARCLKGRRCILVMGRAGWHVSGGLKFPPNIRIVLLPPCSPGLNPVECLWQWLKRHAVRNRLHLTLEAVMDAVEKRLGKTTAEFFRSICLCDYLLQL